MWVDPYGVAHTVAMPDWRQVLLVGERLHARLRMVPEVSVDDAIEHLEDNTYDEILNESWIEAVELEYDGVAPPPLTIGREEEALDPWLLIIAELEQQPIRWRLDYILAFRDLLDELA